MRASDYIRVSSKDLRRQPVRFGLTLAALAISTLILVTLASLSLGARQAIIDELSPDNSLSSIVVTPNKTASPNGLFGAVQEAAPQAVKLDDNSVTQLAALAHVQFAVPRSHVWEFDTFQVAGSSKQFVSQAEGVAEANQANLPLSVGREFAASSSAHEIVLGAAYAKVLGFSSRDESALLGKTITITTVKGYRGAGANIPGPDASQATSDQFNQTPTSLQATIVGVTSAGSNQNSIFIPIGWARQVRTLRSWQNGSIKSIDQLAEDGYTSITVKVDQPANVAAVAAAISNLGYGEVSAQVVLKQVMSFAEIMWVILGAVAIVSLLAAALGIINTMLMVVAEQCYIIGVWRACGASRRQITWQFLLQAVLLGLGGGVIGAAGGIGVDYYVNQRIASLLQAHNFTVTNLTNAPWWLLLGSVALTVLFSLLAGLYPAVRAARQDPSKALAAGQ